MDAVSLCHFPPEPGMWEYERRLKRLATRGGKIEIYLILLLQ